MTMIRDYNSNTDLGGLRECAIAIQNHERSLEPRVLSGEAIVDAYLPDLFRRCAQHQGKLLVADVDGRVAGYVMVLCKMVSNSLGDGDAEFGLITDLVVLDAFQKQGIGTQLLAAAEDEARACGVKWLRVGVLSANHIANGLYHAKGFRPLFAQLEKVLE